MKNVFKVSFLALAIAVVIGACNSNKTEETPATETTTTTTDSAAVQQAEQAPATTDTAKTEVK